MKLNSCLYECSVMHKRLTPKVHQFQYRLFYFALDLDELDAVAKQVHGFSRNAWNLYTFRDRDHLTLPELNGGTLKEHLLAWVAKQGTDLPPETKVTLVTLPRVLGYLFNPVSFYFLASPQGSPLCAVVQVGNTFREMKPYFLPQPLPDSPPGRYRLITPKHFYVSPFSELDLSFDFQLNVPGDRLEIHINDRRGDELVLVTSLKGHKVPLTTARLAWLTAKFPFVTLKVIYLIHWQAFRLWWKRLPFYRKSDNRNLQLDVFNKHSSLKDPR